MDGICKYFGMHLQRLLLFSLSFCVIVGVKSVNPQSGILLDVNPQIGRQISVNPLEECEKPEHINSCQKICSCRWCYTDNKCISENEKCKNHTRQTEVCRKAERTTRNAAYVLVFVLCISPIALLCVACMCGIAIHCIKYHTEYLGKYVRECWDRCHRSREGEPLMPYDL